VHVLFVSETFSAVLCFICTGASDDAVSCSMMLEVLHVMSRDPSPYQHCVIFIFNGAEENILQVYLCTLLKILLIV